jgi:hypothetical protein
MPHIDGNSVLETGPNQDYSRKHLLYSCYTARGSKRAMMQAAGEKQDLPVENMHQQGLLEHVT